MKKLSVLISVMMIVACGPSHGESSGESGQSKNEEIIEELSYAVDIAPIIANKCSRCHNESSRLPDFSTYEKLSESIEIVAEATLVEMFMPPRRAEPLTDLEKAILAEWIQQGLPE